MAKNNAVWGIDIGQCALKALRCRPNEDDGRVTADAFDFIEYPQILSQPDADPVELVREALQTFLSRNAVRGDRIAVSVSGQSGLARFIKLPPVESKKIPDIVKYEARQQIPFALEDVVWDYQQMSGGSEEEGFSLETEVGLFAMKRDQVFRALKPFDDAGIEVDIIQLTPLAIFNYTVFDQMKDLPGPDEYDPENPPESVVVLSLGTDTTDLVITNGYRVWQRSVPLGGSHFTKALTKELRLTFAKAEHLKRNATQAEDPKAVFQAMRPVFNDMLTEIQRSIGFFMGIDRNAKIGRVVALGNAMKLPGLQKYLSQNLGYPVTEVDSYRGLSGSAVVAAPQFKDNLLSFAVCYGLVLQGLDKAKLSTNLLPKEIVTDRLIREKKPWAVGAVAALLLGCAISFLGEWRAWTSVRKDLFAGAISQADQVQDQTKKLDASYQEGKTNFATVKGIGDNIVGNVEGRLLWLELLKAIDYSLPREPKENKHEDISDRTEIHIEEIECEYFPELKDWYTGVADKIKEAKQGVPLTTEGAAPAAAADPAAPAPAPGAAPAAVPGAPGAPGLPGAPAPAPVPGAPAVPGMPPAPAVPGAPPLGGAPGMPGVGGPGAPPPAAAGAEVLAGEGPTGKGWVIQIKGHHFYNKKRNVEGAKFVRDRFMKNLEDGKVPLPIGKPDGNGGREPVMVPIKDLGVAYPVLVEAKRLREVAVTDPNAEVPTENGKPVEQGALGAAKAPAITLKQFDFVLQFCWQETPLSKRLEKEKERAKAAAGGNALAGNNSAGGP